MGRKLTAVALATALSALGALGPLGPAPAGADGTTSVPVRCTVGSFGTSETAADVEATDSVDPVAPGGSVTNTVRVPVPIEDVPVDVTVTEVKVTFPIPLNVTVTGVTFTASSFPSQTWAQVGGAIVVTLSGSIVLGPGKPLPTVPAISVATTIGGFPRTVSWKVPSSIVAKGTWALGGITATCTPQDPNQVLLTTTVALPNRAPTATDAAVDVASGTPRAITLAGTDPDGDALTYAVATPPAHGTLTGTPPALTYTPTAGYTGPDAFTFTVSDGTLSDTGTISLAVGAAPPGAPVVAAPVPGDGTVALAWAPPAATGGGPITSYRVVPVRDGVAQPAVVVPAPATGTTLAGLANGVPYRFRVAATSAAGTGAEATTAEVRPQQWRPFASSTDAVTKLHQWIVGRAPTPAERTLWVGHLDARTRTLGDLAATLRRSTDNTDHVDPVARLYAAYFLRIPDQQGTAHWIAQSRGGMPLTTISRNFSGSQEFRTRYGTLTNRQFVELIYQNILGRPGERSGVDFWTGQLDSGTRSRGWVMIGFSESREYVAAQARNVDAALAWVLLAGRTPTVVQRDATATALAGSSLAVVLRDELRRPEVAARL